MRYNCVASDHQPPTQYKILTVLHALNSILLQGKKLTWLYTAISRKVVGKNVHATIPKGNMGYDQYTVPDDCSCRTYICCFPLALANTFPWSFVPIQISLKKRELKATHNAFQDCHVHFSRQPFSK